MILADDTNWIGQVAAILVPLLAGVGAAIAAGARWYFKRCEEQAEKQRQHEKDIAARMQQMSDRHDDAQRQCQEERRELTERVLDTVTEVKAVVQQNSAVVAENTDATRELAEKIKESH